jgi:hypothetical protein
MRSLWMTTDFVQKCDWRTVNGMCTVPSACGRFCVIVSVFMWILRPISGIAASSRTRAIGT